MRTELYTEGGYYSSAFIKMHVKTTEDLSEYASMSLETEATYFHEYIHFLQDITTTYGFMNISNIVDFIKYSNDSILRNDKNEFNVPVVITSGDNDVKANWELKKIYTGGGKGLNDVKKINSICKCVVVIETTKGKQAVKRLVLNYEDSSGKKIEYFIGAYCIVESMAYTMEQLLYPEVLPKPNKLPYEAVHIICEHLLPDLVKDPLNIVALCDVTLNTFNPGAFLYDILIGFIKNGLPSTPEGIYREAYSRTHFNYLGHTTFDQLIISQGAQASSQLGDYFTTPLFKQNKTWINYIFCSGIDLRLHEPFFMLEIVRKGRILEDKKIGNTYFNTILHKLGSPLTVNDNFDLSMIPSQIYQHDIVPEYFWVIRQIFGIYESGLNKGTHRCEMIEWCQKNCAEIEQPDWTDEKCRYVPWERAQDPDPNYCTFGRLWKTWGMETKIPIT